MPLTPGSRLGPYEIQAPLGAGGMGEVYKARDTRLERTVAVKVLPQRLSVSPESRQRFEREAKTISQLSHPHICALYDVGREGDAEYLVMEYLEGETLSDRLSKGPLPLEQTLRYGTEIAGALDRAHRQGIVHRDLKPGNVMLTKTGIKLLDFGLAKVIAAPQQPSTLTSLPTQQGLTQEGTILGTFQYMAPEQLEGRDTDARTDIWALGCVLYEMATGRKAFSGTSQASLISSIMTSEPAAISALQPLSPVALDRVVKSSLAKDPEERWQSAGDVAKELRWISEGSAAGVAAPAPLAARRKGRDRLLWIAAIVLAAAAGVLLSPRLGSSKGAAPPMQPVRFDIVPPAGGAFQSGGWPSPDGRSIAFVSPDASGVERIWIRALDSVESKLVEGVGDVGDVLSVAWSPDGGSLAFGSDKGVKRIPVTGGTAQPLCAAETVFGLTWGKSGVVVFVPGYGTGLQQVPASGGTPTAATSLERSQGEVAHLWPQFLPDGRRFLFFDRMKVGKESQQGWIAAASLDSKEVRRIRPADSFVGFAEGRLLYIIAGTLYSQAFDAATLAAHGEAVLIPGRHVINGSIVGANAGAAGSTLTFQSDPPKLRRLVVLDRAGRKLSEIGEPAPYVERMEISPDGQRALVVRSSPERGVNELWLMDLARGTAARSGSGVEEEGYPAWSPDSESFVFDWDREGPYDIVRRRVDGSGGDEVLLRTEYDKEITDWSRDGRYVLFRQRDPKSSRSVGVLTIGSKSNAGEPPVRVNVSGDAHNFKLSPDGKWMLWTSADSGRQEVYVERFPEGTARQQVSVGGGSAARFRPDGKEIYFISPEAKFMAASFDVRGGLPQISIPAPLFAVSRVQMEDAYVGTRARNWDVFPDGNRFLFSLPVSETDPSLLTVVLNWAGPAKP